MYRIYGISTPKKEFLEDYSKIPLKDPDMSLRSPSLRESGVLQRVHRQKNP